MDRLHEILAELVRAISFYKFGELHEGDLVLGVEFIEFFVHNHVEEIGGGLKFFGPDFYVLLFLSHFNLDVLENVTHDSFDGTEH